MKKVVLALALSLAAIACGSKSNSGNPKSPEDAQKMAYNAILLGTWAQPCQSLPDGTSTNSFNTYAANGTLNVTGNKFDALNCGGKVTNNYGAICSYTADLNKDHEGTMFISCPAGNGAPPTKANAKVKITTGVQTKMVFKVTSAVVTQNGQEMPIPAENIPETTSIKMN